MKQIGGPCAGYAARILRNLADEILDNLAIGRADLGMMEQVIINLAVNLNMIPTKGMTLPFISYGGSSMLAMGLTLGMALALTRRRPGVYSVGEGLTKAGAYA